MCITKIILTVSEVNRYSKIYNNEQVHKNIQSIAILNYIPFKTRHQQQNLLLLNNAQKLIIGLKISYMKTNPLHVPHITIQHYHMQVAQTENLFTYMRHLLSIIFVAIIMYA